MSDPAGLHGLRIGCVRYLNSRPLIHAYDGPVVFEHPSTLAAMLGRGELDAALIPVFDALRHPGYRLVDNVAIASRGEVYSVVLAYHGELRDVRSVSLDPASLTSANLLHVLLREFHGIEPSYETGLNGDARLLIGSQAIDFRHANGGAWNYLDLGADWMRHTGLPFVFAVWALRENVPASAADAFLELKRRGMECLDEIVNTEPDPDFTRRYLSDNVRFDLGDEEKRGIHEYARLLVRHGRLPVVPQLQFV